MNKEDVRQYLSERGLGSFMNLTKWKELIEIIAILPFPPAFICKYLKVEDDENYLRSLDRAIVEYWGDWSLNTEPSGLPNLEDFYQIEFIKIKPSYAKYRGKYVKADIIDISAILFEKLKAKSIAFEVDDFKNVVIFGYK